MNNQSLLKEYNKVNKAYEELGETLIKAIKTNGLELIDLYYFIQARNKLDIRKNKIEYLIMINGL